MRHLKAFKRGKAKWRYNVAAESKVTNQADAIPVYSLRKCVEIIDPDIGRITMI